MNETKCECPARKSLEAAIDKAVVVSDGNTEINECYYEVRLLESTLWSLGGPYQSTKNAAEKFAARFRKKLTVALSAPCPCGGLREEYERLVKEAVALRTRDSDRDRAIHRMQELADARDIDDASAIRKLEIENERLRLNR